MPKAATPIEISAMKILEWARSTLALVNQPPLTKILKGAALTELDTLTLQ